MKKTTSIRNFMMAGVLACGLTATAGETVSWFDGGLDASWPANASGGEWYCQNLSQMKRTETLVPSLGVRATGLTLDNWAFVGLKFAASAPQSIGLGGGVTEANYATTVLLAPVLKENLPSVDADDKCGVSLVLEDDGALRYYVLAQNDETNGTGANVWKLAGSVPRVTDVTVSTVIGMHFRQDGSRWLVDYTINGATEAGRVVAIGSAPTLSSVRYTGSCTVQALSASYVRYPAWLNTDSASEKAKYDAWASKYDVTDTEAALQWAYILDCANTAAAVSAAKQNAVTEWFEGGVDSEWPDHASGGCWKDTGAMSWSGSEQGVGLAAVDTALTFQAGEALEFDSQAGVAGATVTTRVTFVPHTALPSVEDDDVTGIVLLKETDDSYRFHVLAQQDEQTGSGANVWKPAADLSALVAAPAAPVEVSVRVYRKDGHCHADYTVGSETEGTHVVADVGSLSLGRVCYSGNGTLAQLSATFGDSTIEPHVHGWDVSVSDSQLTASCTNADCWVGSVTLSLVGEQSKSADGVPLTASIEGATSFAAKTDAEIGPVVYYQDNAALASAPVEAGVYEARVSVEIAGAAYTVTRALVITAPTPHDIGIVTPVNGTLETSVTNDVLPGTTVTVIATPAEGYMLASVTVNGEAISGDTFTMPGVDVSVAATFTFKPSAMFTVNGQGYDSFADAMAVAKNGDTLLVGADATFSVSSLGGKSITFDLCGQTLTWESGGYVTSGSITVVDSGAPAGRFELASGNRNYQTLVDMSALTKDQLTGSGKFWSGATTKVVFPADMPFESAVKFMDNKVSGEQIVVQGVTYSYGDSKWNQEGPVPTYTVTITASENGTLETSVTNEVAAGTTVTVTAKPAEGYRLASVTMNGAALSGNSFAMPAADVTLAATFEEEQEEPPTPPPSDVSQMFYIGETGYDTWPAAMNAAKAGDTVIVGKDAEFTDRMNKHLTVDLSGRTLKYTAGYLFLSAVIKIVDSGNGGAFLLPGSWVTVEGELDLSSLASDQFSGTGKIGLKDTAVLKFPKGMPLNTCTSFLSSKAVGSTIVVMGVEYTWNGSEWASSGPACPEWIDAGDADAVAKYTSWAETNGVADPSAAIKDAFLLNCANTEAAVNAAKAGFKITSVVIKGDTVEVVVENEEDFNGKVRIVGAKTLGGQYHDQTSGDRFFKAVLE